MHRIEAVDGLRAIAMTMVVLQHCGLMPFGWMGVWVFYVISGFVVCNSFHSQMTRKPDDPAGVVRHFMFRRVTRIWPVYFLYIIVSAAAFYVFTGVVNWGELTALFGFFYNWEMIFDISGQTLDWPGYGHLWTISVEQQFYILFPLIYFLFIHHRATFRGALVILALSPVLRYLMGIWSEGAGNDDGASAFLVYASSFGHVDAFLFGALLARHRDSILNWKHSELAIWATAVGFTLIYCVSEVAANAILLQRQGIALFEDVISGISYGQLQNVFVYYVPVLGAVAMILSVLKNSWFTRPLANPVMVWIGQISYGAYIFHIAVIYCFSLYLGIEGAKDLSVIQRLLLFLGVYPVTLIVAHLSYKLFETHFSRIKMRAVR